LEIKKGSDMFSRMIVGGRFLGLDIGDWCMLIGGLLLCGLLTLLGYRAQPFINLAITFRAF
jgi:hypothetical protein